MNLPRIVKRQIRRVPEWLREDAVQMAKLAIITGRSPQQVANGIRSYVESETTRRREINATDLGVDMDAFEDKSWDENWERIDDAIDAGISVRDVMGFDEE